MAIDDGKSVLPVRTGEQPTPLVRSSETVQSDSAHHYLDYTAVSPALSTLLELLLDAVTFPSAMINIIDATQQFTIVRVGMKLLPLMDHIDSVCSAVVRGATPIVVEDIDNPSKPIHIRSALRASGMAAYAGVPLFGREGRPIGALCVLDVSPHPVDDDQVAVMIKFAGIVDELLDSQREQSRREAGVSAAVVADAVARGEVIPWYQAIVDLRSGTTVGFEALARWSHPVEGMLLPERFIGAVEATDLIIDLDLAILTRALDDVKRWRHLRSEVGISVNLSGQHFLYPGCIERISATAVAADVEPDSVTLELTETTSFGDVGGNTDYLSRLRDIGFHIVLDDVGVGWSSLTRLLELPVDGFKIDRSVITALGTPVADAMVRALAGFGSETGRTCVAEGIETREQAVAAAELGCTHGQGYLWGHPEPAERVAGVLTEGSRLHP